MAQRLEGQRIAMRAPVMRKHQGAHIKYLRGVDIDHSGRGYLFPRNGVIEDVRGREFFDGSDWIRMSDVVELVIVEGVRE